MNQERIEQLLEGARDPQGHPGWTPTNREIADLCEIALGTPRTAGTDSLVPSAGGPIMTASDFRLMSEAEKYGCYAEAMRANHDVNAEAMRQCVRADHAEDSLRATVSHGPATGSGFTPLQVLRMVRDDINGCGEVLAYTMNYIDELLDGSTKSASGESR